MYFLDTSAILELLYGTEKGEQIRSVITEKPLAISSISIHELFVGLKEKELLPLTNFLREIAVLDFDKKAALKSAELARELKKRGKMINAIDLFIAATGLVHGYRLITCDRHFLNIEQLDAQVF
ncbi:MAG: type II toxin-antitoxin system VapC family toxin [Nanoarchaeota archaeon]|nr:type II toxin-antitoxin system VapC family toxin [Nanoarchaeota archaeon]